MNLSPENKIAGILAPLFALRSEDDLGIGDVGTLRDFIEWAHEIGFRLVQMLPINEVGGDNSPYNAISSVAIEPTTLRLGPNSPTELSERDFQAITTSFDLEKLRSGRVKYRRVRKLKQALLAKAFASFETNATEPRMAAFAAFCEREAGWLEPYVVFRALMEFNGDRENWNEWQADHQSPEMAQSWINAQSGEARTAFSRRSRFFRYVQWIAAEQWRDVSVFAAERGVALMGDIPFGVSYCSADVYAHREIFKLEWSGGAPPEPYFKDDEFTVKWGQNWGIPIYNWPVMRSKNFEWWRQRIRGVKRNFHVFRIDHVLGFYRIYAFPWRPERNAEFLPLTREQMLEKIGGRSPHFVPRDDETLENCDANKREGEEYLRIVISESGSTRVVGEDLGTVPKYVRPSLRSLGIAGFKIPQWEAPGGRVTSGDNYERLSVTTYATHDHKPIRELWAEAHDQAALTREQAAEDLRKIAQFAGIAPREGLAFDHDFYPAIMNALFKSNAWIAIVMMTDLLVRKERFNVPGTAGAGNWTRRLPETIAQMRGNSRTSRRMRLIRDLLTKSGRAPSE